MTEPTPHVPDENPEGITADDVTSFEEDDTPSLPDDAASHPYAGDLITEEDGDDA